MYVTFTCSCSKSCSPAIGSEVGGSFGVETIVVLECFGFNENSSALVAFPTTNNVQIGNHRVQMSSWYCTSVSG